MRDGRGPLELGLRANLGQFVLLVTGIPASIGAVAALTATSGLVVLVRMRETVRT